MRALESAANLPPYLTGLYKLPVNIKNQEKATHIGYVFLHITNPFAGISNNSDGKLPVFLDLFQLHSFDHIPFPILDALLFPVPGLYVPFPRRPNSSSPIISLHLSSSDFLSTRNIILDYSPY